MRRIVLATAATLAILAVGSLVPNRAEAMTVTTPIGIQAAIDGTNLVQDIALCLPAASGVADPMAAAGVASAGGPARGTATTTVAAPTTTAVRITGATGGELGNARQSAVERSDEMRALVAEREAARLQRVARQEIARERKPIGQIAAGGHSIGFAQECRQP